MYIWIHIYIYIYIYIYMTWPRKALPDKKQSGRGRGYEGALLNMEGPPDTTSSPILSYSIALSYHQIFKINMGLYSIM